MAPNARRNGLGSQGGDKSTQRNSKSGKNAQGSMRKNTNDITSKSISTTEEMKSGDKRRRKKPTPLSETNAMNAERDNNLWGDEEDGDEVVRDGIADDGAEGMQNDDDQDDDIDDDDSSDLVDDEVIDEEEQTEDVRAKIANFDSDSASNSSPLIK